ncbi:hypothetical protein ACLMJK_006827 [Lecanora helva]
MEISQLNGSTASTIEHDSKTVPQHPLGLKPAGNAYAAGQNIKVKAGRLATLPDEVVVQILEHLDEIALQSIGRTCRALYAFSRLEDLWKTLFVKSSPSQFTWQGTWYSTYFALVKSRRSQSNPISCNGLFSDLLYRPFQCAHTSLLPFTRNIPAKNSIPRLSDLSLSEFSHHWTDKPFILTSPVRAWPVYQKWSTETLLREYGDIVFRAEAVDWPLRAYIDYMNDNTDESPLYLFDRSFIETMNLKIGKNGHYWAPECFGEDLFASLDEDRPDSRWLIMGPERSGSTFHKDPNATSAWNAVLKGSKYWIMFPTSPSQPPPPGVFVSEDQSEVTSPLSIAEWLIEFHAEARRTDGCMEGICPEGEVLHVPSGWWHLVVNLEPSIAITQNFVPRAHLASVLDFLKNKSDQVSGFKNDIKDPYELFVQRMENLYPNLLHSALTDLEKASTGKKRKWEELVNGSNDHDCTEPAGFGFAFFDKDDGDIP